MSEWLGDWWLIMLAAALTALLAWLIIGDRLPRSRRQSRVGHAPAVLFFGVLAVGFGCYGWSVADGDRDFVDALYLAMQHLYLNAPVGESENWAIQVSRMLAIATIILVGDELICWLFADSLQRLGLLLPFDRVVILGLGDTGVGLLREISDPKSLLPQRLINIHRKRIVVVEINDQCANVRTARQMGATVVLGDGVDRAVLERVGAHRARRVFFAMPTDEQNIDAAATLAEISHARTARPNPDWFVYLRHSDLEPMLADAIPVANGRWEPELRVFGVRDQAARSVVERMLVDLRPTTEREVLHCVIVGFGPMGQLLARRIAEVCHFENLKRTRLTIVCSSSESGERSRFITRYPALFPKPDAPDPWKPDPAHDDWSAGGSAEGVSFVTNGGFDLDEAAPHSPAFRDRLVEMARTPGVLPVVFVCGGADVRNDIAASSLCTELNDRLCGHSLPDKPAHPVHVFAYVPGRPTVSNAPDHRGLTLFGAASEGCGLDMIASDLDRDLAEAFASQYGTAKTKAQAAWATASNLGAARHVHAKLAALGLSIRPVRAGVSPVVVNHDVALASTAAKTKPLSGILARMEHNRWMAERLLAGWRFGFRSDTLKQRTTLLEWDRLPMDEKSKDDDQINVAWQICTDPSRFVLVPRVPKLDWGPAHQALEFLTSHPTGPLVIGWTGHRRLENQALVGTAIRAAIGTLVSARRDESSGGSSVSGCGSLAEGADLLFAEQLRDWNVPYDLILTERLSGSERLMRAQEQALSVKTVQSPESSVLDYQQIGDEIIARCHVLLAVWDNKPGRGPGGTADVVTRALARGKPVITIDPFNGASRLVMPDTSEAHA